MEAPGAGRLLQVGLVGEEHPSGVGIGWFLADGEAPPVAAAPAAEAAPASAPAATAVTTSSPEVAATDTLGYGLDALAAETTRLAVAARERSLAVDELQGSTFSVTALGMFDVDVLTPIINAPTPPSSASVACGTTSPEGRTANRCGSPGSR